METHPSPDLHDMFFTEVFLFEVNISPASVYVDFLYAVFIYMVSLYRVLSFSFPLLTITLFKKQWLHSATYKKPILTNTQSLTTFPFIDGK